MQRLRGLSRSRVIYAEAPGAYFSGPMNDPRLNQQPNTVAKTGRVRALHERRSASSTWSATCTSGSTSPAATFRGGYYLDTHINGDGCAYRTTAHAADYHDYSTGFRCCADAKP